MNASICMPFVFMSTTDRNKLGARNVEWEEVCLLSPPFSRIKRRKLLYFGNEIAVNGNSLLVALQPDGGALQLFRVSARQALVS